MQLKFISLMVSDQAHALDFYTRVLGFEKMADIPSRCSTRGFPRRRSSPQTSQRMSLV